MPHVFGGQESKSSGVGSMDGWLYTFMWVLWTEEHPILLSAEPSLQAAMYALLLLFEKEST